MADAESTSPEYLISQSTHTCLAVIRGSDVHDAVIGMAKCNDEIRQQWFPRNGQWYWAGNQSLCLSKNKNTGGLCLASCDAISGSWCLDEEERLILESQALDVPWHSPRLQVTLQPKHEHINQKWWTLSQLKTFLEDDHLVGEHCLAPSVLEICKMDIDHASCEKSRSLQSQVEHNCQGKENVSTTVAEAQDDISVEPEYLISQSTHTCLTVLNGTCPDDATIGLAPYSGYAKQQWFLKDGLWQWGSNRSYCLAPDLNTGSLQLISNSDATTSWTLDKTGLFTDGSYAVDVPWEWEKTKVCLYPKHGGLSQKWWMLSKLRLCVGRKMYPFSAKDTKAYKQELARGIVNWLCPLSESLPHPRDVVHYPGTVTATTPRINLACTLTVGTVHQAKNLHMIAPQDWQATNIYVVAGEIFTVILSDTLTEKQMEQITVRVGAQCDCLNPTSSNVKNGTFKRMPVVSEEFDVSPGLNRLRSQFGGNLIFTYRGEESFEVTAEVSNIVETPHYILGKTDSTAWLKMKDLGAPFSVLESCKVVLIVPTSKAKCISDIDDLLHRYDDIMEKLEDLSGFTKDDPPPKGKQWLVDDVQITAGSAHAGFPAMFNHQYYDLTSLETPHSWVVWHELGHNYQQGPYWSYAYGSETTVNLFSLYIEETLELGDRLKKENRYMPTIKAVDNGLTFECADCWQKLVFLMEIKHAFPSHGWDMYRHLNRKVRALSEEEAKTIRSSRQRQYDFVYSELSHYIGADLIPHYQRWSIPVSQQAQDEVKTSWITNGSWKPLGLLPDVISI